MPTFNTTCVSVDDLTQLSFASQVAGESTIDAVCKGINLKYPPSRKLVEVDDPFGDTIVTTAVVAIESLPVGSVVNRSNLYATVLGTGAMMVTVLSPPSVTGFEKTITDTSCATHDVARTRIIIKVRIRILS